MKIMVIHAQRILYIQKKNIVSSISTCRIMYETLAPAPSLTKY